MSRQDETRQAKLDKRAKLESEGIIVHPYSYTKTHTVASSRLSLGETVSTAGRIMSLRTHGKVTFLDIQDHTDKIQVMIKEETVGAIWHARLSLIDPSDHLGVTGNVIQTKTGEITIEAEELTILSKALRSVPASFQGIEDKEVRFRKRYLDMLIDPEVKRVLDARWLAEKEIRRYLQDVYQFVEVETPILQPLYGGTNAKPFTTHMNALDSTYYLRIAPELYLKRLIVGGYERIFEIARNFRNEGIDQTHQPEFTMMEWYEAYADYQRVMDVAEGLYKHLAEKVNGNLNLTVGEIDIDLSGDWPRITMEEALLIHNKMDVKSASDEELLLLLSDNSLEITGTFSRGKAIFSLFDHLTTPYLINPTWIIDYPKEVSPLSKQHRSKDGFVERFELYVGTKEMADGWSEITDAVEQRSRFENEQKNMREGDAESQPLDEDFLEAMEYGMPPLGGIGVGIDRLVMFLTNTWSIKEVIAFPTLRPTPEQLKASQMMEQFNTKPTVASKDVAVIEGVYKASTYAIDPAVLRDFAGMFFAYTVIRGVQIEKTSDALEAKKQAVYESKKGITVEEIGEIKSVVEYRKLFKATGTDFHKMRPSPEALLRRIALDKGLYTINTAVDAYNLAVIETGIGLGGFNLAKITEPVVLRYAKAGERMMLLGDDQETILRDNQLVYADAKQPITVDLNYRDISHTKITLETTDVILFADGAPGLTQQEVVHALKKGAEYIQEFSGGTIDPIQVISTAGIDGSLSTDEVVTHIPLTREQATALLESMVENPGLRGHMKAMDIQMRGLWEYFSQERPDEVKESKETWGLIGLLHDADWERTESTPDQHTLVTTERLREFNAPDAFADSIRTHNFRGLTGQREPQTLMEWSLSASDHLSGIIIACALVMPEKKLSMVTVERVLKKFKEKSFAKGATREEILEGLTHLNIDLETLVRVCLHALQENADTIGL